MWGVRRRDAAGHNESGWLIRPEMRFSSSSPSVVFILIFYFISHSHLSCKRADQDEISRAADLPGPVRKRFWRWRLFCIR